MRLSLMLRGLRQRRKRIAGLRKNNAQHRSSATTPRDRYAHSSSSHALPRLRVLGRFACSALDASGCQTGVSPASMLEPRIDQVALLSAGSQVGSPSRQLCRRSPLKVTVSLSPGWNVPSFVLASGRTQSQAHPDRVPPVGPSAARC